MHACRLAEELGVGRILFPRAGGVLSALGLAVSDLRRDYVAPLFGELDALSADELEAAFAALERRAEADLPAPATLRRFADARFEGQSFELTIPADDLAAVAETFRAAHQTPLRLRAAGHAGRARRDPGRRHHRRRRSRPSPRRPAERHGRSRTRGRRTSTASGARPGSSRSTTLAPGDTVDGPAVVELPEATCVVRPGWTSTLDDAGALVLERT